jgi:hypothetical protein
MHVRRAPLQAGPAAPGEVLPVDGLDAHVIAPVRCVDHEAVPQIDRDMVLGAAEVQDVSRPQLAPRHVRQLPVDVRRVVGQVHADQAPGPHDEPRAVEPPARSRRRVDVVDADLRPRRADDPCHQPGPARLARGLDHRAVLRQRDLGLDPVDALPARLGWDRRWRPAVVVRMRRDSGTDGRCDSRGDYDRVRDPAAHRGHAMRHGTSRFVLGEINKRTASQAVHLDYVIRIRNASTFAGARRGRTAGRAEGPGPPGAMRVE